MTSNSQFPLNNQNFTFSCLGIGGGVISGKNSLFPDIYQNVETFSPDVVMILGGNNDLAGRAPVPIIVDDYMRHEPEGSLLLKDHILNPRGTHKLQHCPVSNLHHLPPLLLKIFTPANNATLYNHIYAHTHIMLLCMVKNNLSCRIIKSIKLIMYQYRNKGSRF